MELQKGKLEKGSIHEKPFKPTNPAKTGYDKTFQNAKYIPEKEHPLLPGGSTGHKAFEASNKAMQKRIDQSK